MRATEVRFLAERRKPGRATGLGGAGLRTTAFFRAAAFFTVRFFAFGAFRFAAFFVFFALAMSLIPCRSMRWHGILSAGGRSR